MDNFGAMVAGTLCAFALLLLAPLAAPVASFFKLAAARLRR